MREPIVLLPGLLCTEALWADVTDELDDIASSYVMDLSDGASIASMAERVLAVAPTTFSLAGFSMGSQVALEICARAPNRVKRLALLSANAYGLTPGVRAHLTTSMEGISIFGLKQYLDEAFTLYFSEEKQGMSTLRNRFMAMGHQLGAEVALQQMNALLSYAGCTLPLSSISCSTLFMCGSDDQRTPPSLHYDMARSISRASVSVLPSCGHFTLLESPSSVSLLMREWMAR